MIFFLFFWFRIKINAQRIASKFWSCRDVTRKRRRTIVQLNLLLNYSRQLMKEELIVNENCLNSKLHFYNHFLWYIYFFFLVRNQKIYVLHFSSNFAISWKFFRNVIFDFFLLCLHRSLICSSIQFTRATQYYSRYSSKFWNLKYSMIFDWIIIIDINHCINSWRKTMNYTRRWSKLFWHGYRTLTMHSTVW